MCSNESQASSQASQNTRAQKTFVKHFRKSPWTTEEDHFLQQIMSTRPSEVPWTELKSLFPTKTTNQIYQRWNYVLDPRLRKGSWTVEEDRLIGEWVAKHGTKEWNGLVKASLPQRTPKQCRERWMNQLQTVKADRKWTVEEDAELIRLHKMMGNHWSQIAAVMNGKTDNQVKNRWYSTVSRRIGRMERGQDPDFKRGRKRMPVTDEARNICIDELSPLFGKGCDELFEKDLGGFEGGELEDRPMEIGNSLFDSQFSLWRTDVD
jgi:hypothetical protein